MGLQQAMGDKSAICQQGTYRLYDGAGTGCCVILQSLPVLLFHIGNDPEDIQGIVTLATSLYTV